MTVSGTSSGTIPASFLGLSYEKYVLCDPHFTDSNADLIALFKRLGAGVLRLGGGTVDQAIWTPGGNGTTYLQVTPANVTSLAGFLKATGWQCLYGVNLATSTPQLAAAEVTDVVGAMGSSLLGIEIGSAPDTYGDPGSFFPGNWSLQDYLTRWNTFRAAIVAAQPGVPITGPSCAASNVSSWALPFAESLPAGELSLLTEQYFRGSGTSSTATADFLISPDAVLNGLLPTVQSGAKQLQIPYRLAGCNSFYAGGAPGVSNSYASSLWVLDFLFAAAVNGATGVNMHGGGSISYTPILDSGGYVSAVAPEYYGLLLFSLAGAGTVMATQLSVGSLNATAYAVKTASGGLSLILVNKDVATNLHMTISAGQMISSATLVAMAAPGLSATTGVTIQGAAVGVDGSFSPAAAYQLTSSGQQTTCFVPALGAVLIHIS